VKKSTAGERTVIQLSRRYGKSIFAILYNMSPPMGRNVGTPRWLFRTRSWSVAIVYHVGEWYISRRRTIGKFVGSLAFAIDSQMWRDLIRISSTVSSAMPSAVRTIWLMIEIGRQMHLVRFLPGKITFVYELLIFDEKQFNHLALFSIEDIYNY